MQRIRKTLEVSRQATSREEVTRQTEGNDGDAIRIPVVGADHVSEDRVVCALCPRFVPRLPLGAADVQQDVDVGTRAALEGSVPTHEDVDGVADAIGAVRARVAVPGDALEAGRHPSVVIPDEHDRAPPRFRELVILPAKQNLRDRQPYQAVFLVDCVIRGANADVIDRLPGRDGMDRVHRPTDEIPPRVLSDQNRDARIGLSPGPYARHGPAPDAELRRCPLGNVGFQPGSVEPHLRKIRRLVGPTRGIAPKGCESDDRTDHQGCGHPSHRRWCRHNLETPAAKAARMAGSAMRTRRMRNVAFREPAGGLPAPRSEDPARPLDEGVEEGFDIRHFESPG